MKNMFKVILSLLALGFAASTSIAQPPPGGGGQGGRGGRGGRGGMTVEAIETAVGTLTADQKTKITAIIEKSNKDRQDAMAGGQPDMAKMQEIQTKSRADIRAVLTPDQQKKFDDMPQPGRRGGGAGGPPPAAK